MRLIWAGAGSVPHDVPERKGKGKKKEGTMEDRNGQYEEN